MALLRCIIFHGCSHVVLTTMWQGRKNAEILLQGFTVKKYEIEILRKIYFCRVFVNN